jgi:hypothetical protein
MKKAGLLFMGLMMAILANGQIIKVQGGTSISRLDWNLKGITVPTAYRESLIGYSLFAGIDYFDKQYVNFSSNVGLVRKGGKDEVPLTSIDGIPYLNLTTKPTLDYFSVNTMIDLKYRIKETTPFISFGPRYDYLIKHSMHFDQLKEVTEINRNTFGLIFGGGLKYDYFNFQFGLRADYYLDFNKIAEWTIESNGVTGEVSAKTYTINLTIGYRLKH